MGLRVEIGRKNEFENGGLRLGNYKGPQTSQTWYYITMPSPSNHNEMETLLNRPTK